MKTLLKQLSKKAIELGDFPFTEQQIKNQWLGNPPATDADITATEKRLNIVLPNDYKFFIKITNGFAAANNVEPSFTAIEDIDYLRHIDPDIIEAYSIEGIENIGEQLNQSIIIAGINEEQYFLLIPPFKDNTNWKYWKFANWQPGEDVYENLEDYFKSTLDFTTDMIDEEE